MNVRSVTMFVDLPYQLDEKTIASAGKVAQQAKATLVAGGFTVQTIRMATQPLAEIVSLSQIASIESFARVVELTARQNQIDYVSLGVVRLEDDPGYVDKILAVLHETERVFASVEMARSGIGIDLSRLKATAKLISEAAKLTGDGFANLRLAALANVGPWSPFFPAAYHGGGKMCLALAIESADIAVRVVSAAGSLAGARRDLIAEIERQAAAMEKSIKAALDPAIADFRGIDFSFSPYPEDARSIGLALEKLGLPTVGASGTMLAAAFLAETLERARFTRTGFCGLMLPVLEDSVLARRTAESRLGIIDLLVYCAICGTGLDTLPLPGDITESELAAILADVAALALRLGKQLTARLMPVPGKKAGDPVKFDFEYFAGSRVLEVSRGGLERLLGGDEIIDLLPHLPNNQAARR